MESREASALITSPNSDDESSLSFTYALAKEAAVLFHSGNFSDCLQLLLQLLHYKPTDPKVLHNIAVVENIEDGFSNPKKFLEVLNDVKKRSEELASAPVENLEDVSNAESNVVAVSNGSSILVPESSAAHSSKIVQFAEFSTHVASFNIAVTWFNLCEYSKSFSILEPVYRKVAPISEGIALRVCLLLLDVALLSHDALRSAEVIDYVEKISCVTGMMNQGENVSHAQLQPQSLVTRPSSVPNSTPNSEILSGDSATNTSEISLSRSLSEEAEYENLFSTLDMSGQNLSRPSVLHSLNDISRTQVDDSLPVTDLRLKLHLYKVRFLLLTRNPKAAKREVKMAMNIARGNNSMVLFLKAQLEYARGNHPKAIKLLMASSNRTEIGTSIMFYNNLGCIHFQLGKYQTSALYFSKALSTSSAMRKEKPHCGTSFSADKYLRIAYNCGMQYLACGKPILAARCFHKASLISYNRPLLWLRIAECCLMALEKGLLYSDGDLSSRSEVKVRVVGKGKWRHLVIEDRELRSSQAGFIGREDSLIRSDKQPKLSMSLARQCLLNALQLLNSSESLHLSSGLPSDLAIDEKAFSKSTNYKGVVGGDSQAHNMAVGSGQFANGELKEPKGASILNATLQNSVSDHEDICRKEIQIIRQSVLADLAYVELELGNPLKALSTARTLLKFTECSKIYLFLANVFAAEALCLLNRPKEAAEHLMIYLTSGNIVEHPFTQEDYEFWRVDKNVKCEESNGGSMDANNPSAGDGQVFALNSEEARGTLYADLATISARQGDLEQASRFSSLALSTIPNSPEAMLTATYLDLMWGKPHEAVKKFKNFSRVSFLDGSFAVKGSL
ncbi:hypothetical protein DCAR_0625451 [Daucus carota subsp. sativus]|uniref:CCR4-NOT transcription complex subunit 10 n=1 Tax=Daucus carota subsp. sativus TaxID=79200 RepID=A0AAF0XDQ5_DAUCS|nr:PREDICTED: CCR4-NOT transcription complex subunit 10-like [Daucus carota subsp. sativus]WOH06028.1 hypothetical protein DCAR_0625451 [Daucus carota subsp. sativus]